MKHTNSDTTILSLTLYREARGEGLAGMVAVGCVIRNRALSQNKSVYEICTAPEQFSSLTVHSDPETITYPQVTDTAWICAQNIASDIISCATEDVTNGALYYANLKTATSGWFATNISGNPTAHPVTVTIGNHTFFK